MEKWLVLGQEQKIYKMNLEYLIVAESKEVFKNTKTNGNRHIHNELVRGVGADEPTKELPMARVGII